MKQLMDQVTFRHGAAVNNRLVQAPMLTNFGKDEVGTQDNWITMSRVTLID